jgi:hypothetical protein
MEQLWKERDSIITGLERPFEGSVQDIPSGYDTWIVSERILGEARLSEQAARDLALAPFLPPGPETRTNRRVAEYILTHGSDASSADDLSHLRVYLAPRAAREYVEIFTFEGFEALGLKVVSLQRDLLWELACRASQISPEVKGLFENVFGPIESSPQDVMA